MIKERYPMPRFWLINKIKNDDNCSVKSFFDMLEKIANEYDLKRQNRKREVVDKRHYFSWYCVIKLEITSLKTAEIIERDHATVLHSKKRVFDLLDSRNKMFQKNIKEIKADLEKINLNEI